MRDPYPTLTPQQTAALRAYAAAHGRYWKTRLSAEWLNASADPVMHNLRNSHGPTWLYNFRISKLDR